MLSARFDYFETTFHVKTTKTSFIIINCIFIFSIKMWNSTKCKILGGGWNLLLGHLVFLHSGTCGGLLQVSSMWQHFKHQWCFPLPQQLFPDISTFPRKQNYSWFRFFRLWFPKNINVLEKAPSSWSPVASWIVIQLHTPQRPDIPKWHFLRAMW